MRRSLLFVLGNLLLAVCFLSNGILAATLPVGFVIWDVPFPGNAGSFDISNQTGPNASVFPDTTFPITTELSLSGLSLSVNFSDGSSKVFGSSYFTLSADGESFNGNSIAIGGTNPLPTMATLTGTLSPLLVTLNSGGTQSIDSSFSSTILPSTGKTLSDADLAIIYASPGGAVVPEPRGTWMVVLIGLVALAIYRRKAIAHQGRML